MGEYIGRHRLKDEPRDPGRRKLLISGAKLLGFTAATSAIGGTTGALILERTLANLGLYEIDPDLESKFPFSDEMMRELNTPIALEDPKTGQKLNAILLNKELFDQGVEPIVTFQGYNAEIGSLSGKLGYGILATKTKRPVLAIDYPDVGGSDPLTPAQIASFEKGEGFLEMARATGRALKEFGIRKAVFVGNSMAASFIAVLLSQLPREIEVRKAILGEPVGIIKFDLGELRANFTGENKYVLEALTSPTLDPPHQDLILQASFQDTALGKFAGLIYFPIAMFDNDPRFFFQKTFTQDFVQAALELALQKHKNLIIVTAHGTESKVCPNPDMIYMVGDLNQKSKGRVEDHPILGKSHVVFINPIVFANFVSQHL